MKKNIKRVLFFLIFTMIAILLYVKLALPNIEKLEYIAIKPSASKFERGKYLVNNVCVCTDCHSDRNWNRFSGPLIDETIGMGGTFFGDGYPGSFTAKNITPSGIGNWTDGELLRAIACGVSKDGSGLFPVMPYLHFGQMDKEDLESIIVYLRTLKPIKNIVPESSIDFPMNFLINTLPKEARFSIKPNPEDMVAYGRYMFNAASCSDCHTKQDNGKPIVKMALAGGLAIEVVTGGTVFSANITSDKETGIGKWTEADFIQRFKSYSDSTNVPKISQGDFNTVMPWTMYAGMTEQDLKAIYIYLRTIKPIHNSVDKFSNP